MSEQREGGAADRHQIVELEYLQGLIAAVDASGIDTLEISRGGTRIRIAKSAVGPAPQAHASGAATHAAPAPTREAPPQAAAAAPAAVEAPAPPKSSFSEVKSPMVGTFFRSPTPEAPSYVEVGSRVVRGQTLCILEAMKLMNELQAEIAGVVREVCVENAEPVEYGQVLFRIEPDA